MARLIRRKVAGLSNAPFDEKPAGNLNGKAVPPAARSAAALSSGVEIAASRVDLTRHEESVRGRVKPARDRLGRHVVQVADRGRILTAHRGESDTGDETQSSSMHSIPHP